MSPTVEQQRDWLDPVYLLRGGRRQRAAYQALQALKIFETLANYTPVLAGTLPLGIDISTSDLDVLCEQYVPGDFIACVEQAYAHFCRFNLRVSRYNDLETIIANFEYAGFPVEIFGQPRPVVEQNAYQHMLVEARLLEIGGEPARWAIQGFKARGQKTEPAFARYFNLPGDPYQALLDLRALDRHALATFITQR